MIRWIVSSIILINIGFSAILTQPKQTLSISVPTLKWQYGGCTSWCQTGWYSSPVVADLDGNGSMEVIAGAYSFFILNGIDGTLKQPAIAPPASNLRIWSDIALADLENDGIQEIIVAYANGYLRVFNNSGSLIWSRQPTPSNELRSLGVYDLDNNGDLEIMVASTISNNQWWVYEHTGSLRLSNWPQHSPDSDTNGWTAGAFNQNLAAADLDGDDLAEIVGPNDTHYMAAFHADGSQVRANAIYGLNADGTNKFWSRVGVHVDHVVDLRGYANCGIEHRPNFANSAPTIYDLDNNGSLEVITVGNVYNCDTNPYTDLYEMPFIFNGDRTRWQTSTYNWTVIPIPDQDAAPLNENWEEIESNVPNPVIADLDGDGEKEIIYPSYDGRLHAYWLDKTEHGNFPFQVYDPQDGYISFASEPAVADLDNDGQAELIFTTWVEKNTTHTGKLIILNANGDLLQEVSLPGAKDPSSWNGAMAAPTLANIDQDADLEVVINTAQSGVLAYDLPNTQNAQIIWESGRGNYWRSGSPVFSDLNQSSIQVNEAFPVPGETITIQLYLSKTGILPDYGNLSLPIPDQLTYSGGLSASSGNASLSDQTIYWEGDLLNGEDVEIQFNAQVNGLITDPTLIQLDATLAGRTTSKELQTWLFVYAISSFLPFIQH
jgi:hypothetical protein